MVLFAGLGHSERVADYWERFGNDKQSVASNSAFHTDPERTTQLDVGLLRRGERGTLSVSLFASRIADYILIDARPVGKPMGTVVARNVDAGTWGGEVEYDRQLGGAWQVESSLAYTRGRNITDHVALAQMPPLEGRLALGYRGQRFNAGALLRLVADQHRVDIGRGNIVGQDIGTSDGFAVFSINGSYRLSRRLESVRRHRQPARRQLRGAPVPSRGHGRRVRTDRAGIRARPHGVAQARCKPGTIGKAG